MLKILQVGDVHLDSGLDYLNGEKREARNKQIEDTFIRIIDLALKERVELLLVTGDLFENNSPSKRVISLVNKQFQRLLQAEIKIVILPGNRDCWGPKSVYQKIRQEAGIYLFTKPFWEHFLISEFSINFYGYASVEGQDYSERVLPKLSKTKINGLHIGLFHGSLQGTDQQTDNYYPFSLEELEKSGLDYWALGHYHRCLVKEEGVKAGYGGSPEGLDFPEVGASYVLLLQIEDGRLVTIERKRVDSHQLKLVVIKCQDYTNLEEITSIIMAESQSQLLLKVVLEGVISQKLDLEELRERLQERFFYLDIQDKTTRLMDCLENSQDLTVKRYFLELMTAKIEESRDEKEKKKLKLALSLGIEALMGGEKGC